jgi:hypothetical protein
MRVATNLPPRILQQAEEHLARLVEMPEVRTAFLLICSILLCFVPA